MFGGDERGVMGRGLMWGVGRELGDMVVRGHHHGLGPEVLPGRRVGRRWPKSSGTGGQKKGRTGYVAEILGLLRTRGMQGLAHDGEHCGVIGLRGLLGRGSQVGFRCNSCVPPVLHVLWEAAVEGQQLPGD